MLAPDSEVAWARLAHALARTDRISDCLQACKRALELADDPEVRDLREQVVAARAAGAPRRLSALVRSSCSGSRNDSTTISAASGTIATNTAWVAWASPPLATRAVSSAPRPATARLPPIERKNWIAAVATPISVMSTRFWVAITNVWNIVPMPRPTTVRSSVTTIRELSPSSSASRMQPASTRMLPRIGKTL